MFSSIATIVRFGSGMSFSRRMRRFSMKSVSPDNSYSDEETARRRDELAKKMLNTPPKPLKPHSEMKLGKAKSKSAPVAGPKKGGRPEKDDSKS